jgi:hypothetical protein
VFAGGATANPTGYRAEPRCWSRVRSSTRALGTGKTLRTHRERKLRPYREAMDVPGPDGPDEGPDFVNRRRLLRLAGGISFASMRPARSGGRLHSITPLTLHHEYLPPTPVFSIRALTVVISLPPQIRWGVIRKNDSGFRISPSLPVAQRL